MQDLLALCQQSSSVLFRPGEEPVDGRCPFNNCWKSMNEYVCPSSREKLNLMCSSMRRAAQNDHLHACHKKQLQNRDTPDKELDKKGDKVRRSPFT